MITVLKTPVRSMANTLNQALATSARYPRPRGPCIYVRGGCLEALSQQELFPGKRGLQSALPRCYERQSRNSGISGRAQLPCFSHVVQLLNNHILCFSEYHNERSSKAQFASSKNIQRRRPSQDAILTDFSHALEWATSRPKTDKPSRKQPKTTKHQRPRSRDCNLLKPGGTCCREASTDL